MQELNEKEHFGQIFIAVTRQVAAAAEVVEGLVYCHIYEAKKTIMGPRWQLNGYLFNLQPNSFKHFGHILPAISMSLLSSLSVGTHHPLGFVQTSVQMLISGLLSMICPHSKTSPLINIKDSTTLSLISTYNGLGNDK